MMNQFLRQLYNLIFFIETRKCRRLGSVPPSILFPVVWVTNRCNLRCKMCNQWKIAAGAPAEELSSREWYSFVDSAKHMHAAVIAVTGGEPLLREDIFDIIKYIRKNQISCHLCTNGTLLNELNVLRLKESKINSISVSLDSDCAQIHNRMRGIDCFDAVVRGIKLLRSTIPGLKIGINQVVTKINFRNMDRMIPFAESLKVDQIKFDRVHVNLMHRHRPLTDSDSLVFNKDDLPDLQREIAKLINAVSKTRLLTSSLTFMEGMADLCSAKMPRLDCYAGYISCAVDAFGRVSPCDDFDGEESLREKNLETIWQSASFQKLRQRVHSCNSSCWDTTHAELNIRCSDYGLSLIHI